MSQYKPVLFQQIRTDVCIGQGYQCCRHNGQSDAHEDRLTAQIKQTQNYSFKANSQITKHPQ